MATISQINIKLGVQTQGLTTGFAKAGKDVKRFESQVNSASGGMSKMGAVGGQLSSGLSSLSTKFAAVASGALAAVAAFAAMTVGIQGIKAAFADLDRVANLADATEFSGGFIRGLEYAADQAGSSTEAIGKSLQRFTRMLGEAEGGGKKAVEAFAELGLSVDQLTQMSPEEAFLATAEAISRLPEAGEKAAKAYALFGRSGQELVNVLSQGKQGLEDLIAQNERVRGSVSGDEFKGIQNAQDAVSRAMDSFKGIGEQLAIVLAPAVEKLADEFTALFIDGREGFEAWAPAIAGFADVVVERITEFIHATRIAIVALKDLAGWLETSFGAGTIENIGRSAAHVGVFISRLTNIPFEAVKASIGEAVVAGEKIGPIAERIAQSTDEMAESLEDSGKAAEEAKKKVDEMAKAGERLTDSLRSPLEVIADDLAHAQQLMQQGMISWETYMRAIGKADEALAELNKTKNDLGTETNVGFVDRNTQAGYAAMFGKTEKANEEIVNAITEGDAQIVATLQQVITAAKEGGVTIVKRTLD